MPSHVLGDHLYYSTTKKDQLLLNAEPSSKRKKSNKNNLFETCIQKDVETSTTKKDQLLLNAEPSSKRKKSNKNNSFETCIQKDVETYPTPHHGSVNKIEFQKFFCKTCNKNFTRQSTLNRHNKDKHPELNTETCIQEDSTTNPTSVKKITIQVMFICEICKKNFSSQSTLNEHYQYKHPKLNTEICMQKELETHRTPPDSMDNIGFKVFLCEICNREFRGQSELNRHNKDKHPELNTVPCVQEDLETYLVPPGSMDQNGFQVYNKDKHTDISVEKSIQIKLEPNPTPSPSFSFSEEKICEICNKVFSRQSTLKKHIKNKHSELEFLLMKKKKFQCSGCSNQYNNKQCLARHERSKHNIQTLRINQTIYKCHMCDHEELQRKTLLSHLEEAHQVKTNLQTLPFKSEEECLKWIKNFEQSSNTKFVATGGKHKDRLTKSQTLVCHRANKVYFPKTERKRKLKLKGSCKLNIFCPAYIKYWGKNENFELEYIDVHLHELDLEHKGNPELNTETCIQEDSTTTPTSVEKITIQVMFICEICKKNFSSQSTLNEHYQNKHPKLNTEICMQKELETHPTPDSMDDIGFKVFLCEICNREFRGQSELNRHNKDKHPELNTVPCVQEELETYPIPPGSMDQNGFQVFLGDICNKELHEESELNAHDTHKHPDVSVKKELEPNPTPSPTFSFLKEKICKICNIVFSRQSTLKSHIKNKHSEYEFLLTKKKKFQCRECSNQYNNKQCLARHEKSKHNIKTIKINQTIYKCPMCDHEELQRKTMISHIEEAHQVKIHLQTLPFKSEEECFKWIKNFEQSSNTKFVATGGRHKDRLTKSQTLVCHRANKVYFPKTERKRKLKLKGSCKLNIFCPAYIKYWGENENFKLEYIDVHLHELDLEHMRLTNTERCKIAEKISVGGSFTEILDDIRESYDKGDEIERIHLVTRKDLFNIAKSFNLKT